MTTASPPAVTRRVATGDGRSDAETVADSAAEGLDGRDDADLAHPVRAFGAAFLMMIGPHSSDGFCWCQVATVPCPSGLAHDHTEHREVVH